jgi:hypothetical protein
MQFKRTALLALSALALAACGDDDGPTGGNGLNDAQRLAAFNDLVQAGANAQARGAEGVIAAFTVAGYGYLFGSNTAAITATSNGLSLATVGSPNTATAGSYQALVIRFVDNENYGGGEIETYESNVIVARRDTSEAIWAWLDETRNGSFDIESQNWAEGGIYSAPNKEWYATAGTVTVGAGTTGAECNLSTAIRNAIEDEMGADSDLESWTCRQATFQTTFNMTASEPNDFATGSRTASFSGSIPGIIMTANWDYSGPAR